MIFKDSNTANKARLEMNLSKLKGHAIRLMWEERDNNIRYNSTNNLFVKGVPFNVQPSNVKSPFVTVVSSFIYIISLVDNVYVSST